MSLAATSESVLERKGTPRLMSSARRASEFTRVPLCESAMIVSPMVDMWGCADSQLRAPEVP